MYSQHSFCIALSCCPFIYPWGTIKVKMSLWTTLLSLPTRASHLGDSSTVWNSWYIILSFLANQLKPRDQSPLGSTQLFTHDWLKGQNKMVLTGISHAGGHFKFTMLYFFLRSVTDFKFFYFSYSLNMCCLFVPGLDLRHKVSRSLWSWKRNARSL